MLMKILLQSLLLSFVLVWYANAQWVSRPTSVSQNLYGIEFATKDIGFASGWNEYYSVVLRTSDGGTTWAQTPLDSMLVFGIHTKSDKDVFIAGYDQTCNCAMILQTTDGGYEWQKKTVQEYFGFYSFTFPTATTGYVCGYGGGILRTKDGGASWQPLETGTDIVFRNIVFPSANVGYAVGGEHFNLPDQIYKTIDGGDSWELQRDFQGSRSVGDIYFRDEVTGFMVGSDYKAKECVYKTTDGGATWANTYSGPNKDIVLQAVDFASDMKGYAVGTLGRIIETTDGGDSWSEMELETNETLLDVTVSPDGTVFATGLGGLLLSYSPQSYVHQPSAAGASAQITHSYGGIVFRFASENIAKGHLHIYDVLGRQMRDIELNASEYLLSGLSSGSYFWKYDDESGKQTSGFFIVS